MKKTRYVSVLLIMVMLLMPITASAANKEGISYLALGDSIVAGMGGTDGVGYAEMLNEHFEKAYGKGIFNNAAESGLDSNELLEMINPLGSPDLDLISKVSAANIITISIGGNDILTPVIEAFQSYLAMHPGADPNNIPEGDVIEIIGQLQPTLLSNVYGFTGYNPLTGVTDPNNSSWAKIMGSIRTYNLNAAIFVNTLYNPFKPGDVLYDTADQLITAINAAIEGYAECFVYKVVDVYGKFSEYNNPQKTLVHGLDSPVALHPTDRGFKFICNLHKDLME